MSVAVVQQIVEDKNASWYPKDLSAVLSGEIPRAVPTMFLRDGKIPLIYPGKTHVVAGEPGGGKSFVCLAMCVERIKNNECAMYIDYEDNEEMAVERIVAMGVTPEEVVDKFSYIRPETSFSAEAQEILFKLVLLIKPAIVIIDGVTAAFSSNGLKISDNDDAAKFHSLFPKPISELGPAVVSIDHVTKSKDSRGEFAIGGQDKKSQLSGVLFMLTEHQSLGRGSSGVLRLTETKDRPGWLKKHRLDGSKRIADFHLSSNEDGSAILWSLTKPNGMGENNEFEPTGLMELVSRYVEEHEGALKSAILRNVRGKREQIELAIGCLLGTRHIEPIEASGNRLPFRSVTPYRKEKSSSFQKPAPELF